MAREAVISRSARRLAALPGRLRETGGLSWRALSRVGRVSVAGVAASAVLAVALGLYIPRVAERHALESELDAMSSLVRVLEEEHLVPPIGDRLSGEEYARFDRVVRGGLLGGENLRVKLWNPHGEIVYSDERRVVGGRFPISGPLASAFAGTASAEISELSDEENKFDRLLGDRLLEFYLPLRGDGGVIGAFEIYQDFGHLESHLAAIRSAVWIAVGTGLSILLVFLALLFAATARTMARERQEAMERAEDLALLLQTSRALSQELSLERSGPAVLADLTSRLGLRCAALVLEGHEPRFTFAQQGKARVCPLGLEAAREARDGGHEVAYTGRPDATLGHAGPGSQCSVLAVPFHVEPGLTGALLACRDGEHPLGGRERVLLSGVASQLGAAAEGAKLFADLRQMTESRGQVLRRLVDAQEEERRHLVGDLHDGLGQTLTRILYGLRGSRARLAPDQAEIAEELARLEALTDEQSGNLRRYIAAIRPALLEDFGLSRAVEAFAREQAAESGLSIDARVAPLPELDPAAGITLLRAAQEAVINARKHAEATRLWLRLEQQDATILLEVRDDGRGTPELEDGIGLTYMRDRVASLGGRVDVDSRPGRGTTVTVRVPVAVGHGNGTDPRR